MVVGVGIDICENDRISALLAKYQERFLHRVFTEDEIKYCMQKKDPVPHLAARFAVKEAFIKALGMPRDLSISYRDVSLKGSVGKKEICITGKLAALLKQKKADMVHFSISHARDYSNACVILECRHGQAV
ncbi:MAG: holo-ACP synthase [Turneriella sp.]|nr:holo-ACP synthase [Turneriella sp.]